MVELPQSLYVDYIPIDNGNIYTIEILPEFECTREEVLYLLKWAVQSLEEALEKEEKYDHEE